jgi:hypothetical protein
MLASVLRDLSEVSSIKDSRHLLNIDGTSIFNLPMNTHQSGRNRHGINGCKRLQWKNGDTGSIVHYYHDYPSNFPSSMYIQ